MPDTAVIENEDALAADFDEAGEEEERPQTFAELGVPGPLVRVLAADGKKTAFPIQADTLPDSLAGRDILGRGRTGSGKIQGSRSRNSTDIIGGRASRRHIHLGSVKGDIRRIGL